MSEIGHLRSVLGGNDYSAVQARLTNELPIAPISIVMATYNRADKLARTLAAATHLDVPSGGLEIVVADDGSTDDTGEVVRKFEARLNITHVRRPDRGHRLAEICNVGIRTARHDRIVMLQSDMMPSRCLLSAYGRWLDLHIPTLLIGMRSFTSTDHLTADEIAEDPAFEGRLPKVHTRNEMWSDDDAGPSEDWRQAIYRETNWLKNESAPFRAVVGSNLAFHRHDALRIGGFLEEFQHWGGEDGEFGYRAFLAGFALIPVAEAVAYHQEPPGGVNETDRRRGFEASRLLREDRCALPPFRRRATKDPHTVPKVAVDSGSPRGAPLAAETLASLDGKLVGSGTLNLPITRRLQALAATAAPILFVCGNSWPDLVRLPPDILNFIMSGHVDGVAIEAQSPGLLIGARAWNRVANDLDPSVKDSSIDVLIGHLEGRLVLVRVSLEELDPTYGS